MDFPRLFEPVKIGSHTLKNRIMRLATGTQLAAQSRVSERQIEFYRTLARGGCGSIVTESMNVTPGGAPPSALNPVDPDIAPGLRKLADIAHEQDALFIGQLGHPGRQHHLRRIPPAMVAPSAIACPRSGGVPHELTSAEIKELIALFATAAGNCAAGGCDGIELHCAQGHLLQQFLSPFSNQRTDDYGGSLENRLRFVNEMASAVRDRIGPRAVLGLRFSVDEFSDGGITIEDAVGIAPAFTASGLFDYLSLSQSNFNSIDAHLPDRHYSILPFRAQHARIRAAVPGLPIVASTRIQTPAQAEELIAAGEADLVGLARALIVDPEWPEKARTGRARTIRKCIACNQCHGSLSEGETISCATNPVAGRELALGQLKPADRPRRVAIVGGGPAGLEAARVAALRGHHVTLFEASDSLGGKMRNVSRVKYYEETGHLLEFLIPQVEAAGATIQLGRRVEAKSLLAEKPDAIVLATGAAISAPRLPGDGTVPVMTCDGPLKIDAPRGARVVLFDEDDYYWGAAVAESGAQAGYRMIVVTRRFEPYRELAVVSRIGTLRALDRDGASIHVNSELHRIERGGVVARHYLSGREERIDDVAAVVWIGAQTQDNRLRDDLRAAGFANLSIVGDAVSPRRLRDALQEAHSVGRRL